MASNAIQNLIGNRDAIRKLMSMEGEMNQIAKNARKNGTLSMEGEDVTYANPSKDNLSETPQPIVNEQVMANHPKMPKAVLESFRKNPGKSASLSVLGDVPEDAFKPKKQEKIQESHTPLSVRTGNIDYSLIKTIINEAVQENVKKYMSAMSKKLINEGIGSKDEGNNLMCMKIGNGFSFIDESGNIYKANLEFVKNINNK